MARVCIVDDSRLARTVAATCVRKLGHEVEEIDPTSIFDVLTALRSNPPAIILTDYLMPNCPGLSLARSCHEDAALRHAHVVVITAHRDDEVLTRMMRMGVTQVLHKPFNPQDLMDLIQELVASPKA
ncbi:response regulator [Holophaga foetida]|uniref:response regulator n=1 Tax=Holophaga foetida TaxID=35839 RepID=UPI00024732FA|nr:response regulator [Holophaga foetida]